MASTGKTYIELAEQFPKDDFASLRGTASKALADSGFPTKKTEGWRKTNLASVLQQEYQPATGPGKHVERAWWWDSLNACHIITMANGEWNRTCSQIDELPDGLEIMSLQDAVKSNGTLKVFGQISKPDENPFTALNTATFRDGIVVKVKADAVIEQPIHIFHQTHADTAAVHAQPRLLVIAERNSAVQIVESFSGAGEKPYFVNSVTEFSLAENAQVDHVRIQDDSRTASHIGSTWIRQARDSRFYSHAMNLGGRLSRNDIVAWLDDTGIECRLNGLYLGVDEQVHDTHSVVHHAKPHCVSHELYKGILDDNAQGIFNGKIFVHRDAQQTDAIQNNAALLLSDDTRVYTEPQLEIYADDVKCTHGATVGQLDDLQLFYLESRGIDAETARGLLTVAFAAEALSTIKIHDLFEEMDKMLLTRFSEG